MKLGTSGGPGSIRHASAAGLALALALGYPPDPVGAQTQTTLSDTERTIHLLSRATFGVRLSDVAAVRTSGREAWLDEQLEPARIDDEGLAERLEQFPAASMSQSELYAAYPPPQTVRRMVDADSLSQAEYRRLVREMGIQGPGRIVFDLAGAKLQRAVYSERQLEEVMTDFWFDHFNVFFAKGADRWLVSEYEREAIRPYVFGRFEDMLVATASHPAMLVYLDNWMSMVPDSLNPNAERYAEALERWERMSPRQRQVAIQRGAVSEEQVEQLMRLRQRVRGRNRDINENYARELLELHTLGVDGGYTQDDVIEVARVFTGWTIVRPGLRDAARDAARGRGSSSTPMDRESVMMMAGPEAQVVRFQFRPEMHDPGRKSVLGLTIVPGGGMDEGLQVLAMLAHHPATAEHIAYKLVQAFVADEPPQEMVDELAAVFRRTGGDLKQVTRALFSSEHFYDAAVVGRKVKSPFQLIASALRVTGAEVGPSPNLMAQLRSLGDAPYLSPVPTGYPENSQEWVNSGAMLQRMNFALALAGGQIRGVRIPSASALATNAEASGADEASGTGGASGTRGELPALLAVLLPGVETGRLRDAIDEDLEARSGSRRALETRAMGLALGSPEFQRR